MQNRGKRQTILSEDRILFIDAYGIVPKTNIGKMTQSVSSSVQDSSNSHA